jgi:hypothetical protein
MQSGQERHAEPAEQREREVIGVEMQHVELARALRHVLHHHMIGGDPVLTGGVEADRHWPNRLQFSGRDAVA